MASEDSYWARLRKKHPLYVLDVNQLELGNHIGSGGFGDVYKSVLTVNGVKNEVAYKRISKNVLIMHGKDIYREIITMMTFTMHPNIVTPFGVIADEKPNSDFGVGIVMELATEKTLFELLWEEEKKREITLIQRLQIIVDICKGLKAMHEANFVHGDLKAMNILLFDELTAKVIYLFIILYIYIYFFLHKHILSIRGTLYLFLFYFLTFFCFFFLFSHCLVCR